MASRSLLHPTNETEHSTSRVTREGRKLTYTLKVIQQPERARACGAGAKSSADRRPVDPPPVVELRIFESDLNDMHKTDITFGYNANFFLFATLDTARPMAHGRVQGQPPACPVLTGVPVAGIAYLDRPSQAGYFIFPDLSVRHEGRYRLNFNLYEEIKDAKDADKDAPLPAADPAAPTMGSKPMAPKSFLNFRLEVKSVPFTVYSAKKFPGLAESTSLSRIVAEQGCRVRIRRDVRMRRREPKGNKDYGDYDDERGFVRADRYMTPDPYAATPVERPRSTSNSNVETPYSYSSDRQRRPSMPEYGYHNAPPPPTAAAAPPPYQTAHQQPPAPPAPPSASTSSAYLSFGSAQPQYQTPQLPAAQQTQPSAPPPPPYSPHPSVAHGRHASTGSEYEAPSSSYQYPPPPPPRPAEKMEYAAKPALPSLMAAVPLDPPREYNPQSYRRSDPEAYQSSSQPPSAVPRSKTPGTGFQPLSIPKPPTDSEAPITIPAPLPSPSTHDRPRGMLYKTDQTLSSKRSHADVFGSTQEQPLHHGMRPDTERPWGTGLKRLDLEADYRHDDFPIDRSAMEYRRADGSTKIKTTPATQKV